MLPHERFFRKKTDKNQLKFVRFSPQIGGKKLASFVL